MENEYRNNIDILGVNHFEEKVASRDEIRGFEYFLFNNFFEKKTNIFQNNPRKIIIGEHDHF